MEVYQVRWKSLKFWSRAFLVCSALNALCCGTIAVLHALLLGEKEVLLVNLLHCFLLAVGFVVQGVHSVVGIFEGNQYELTMAHIIQIFITIVVILVCFSIPMSSWPITHILLFCYGCTFQLLYFICAVPLYQQFPTSSLPIDQDTIPDENEAFLLKYQKHILFASLLKVDLLLSIVNIGIFDSEISNLNWLLIALAAFLATAIHYATGWYGHRYEKSPVVVTFWGLCTVIPVLVAFGVYKLSTHGLDILNFLLKSEGGVNFKLLFLCSAFLGITIRVLLVYQSVRLFKCFDEGRRVVDFIRDTNEDIISGAVSHMSIHDVIVDTLRHTKTDDDPHLSGQLAQRIVDPYSDVEDNPVVSAFNPSRDSLLNDKFEFSDE